MEKTAKLIILLVISFFIWLLITWQFAPQWLLSGLAAALLVSLFFAGRLSPDLSKVVNPARYFWLIVYIPVFLFEMVKANLDVAYRVLHPALPINPGLVKVKTSLKGDLARTVLGNSLTLTPGNTTVDVKENNIYVHCIDVKRDVQATVSRFENILKKVFE